MSGHTPQNIPFKVTKGLHRVAKGISRGSCKVLPQSSKEFKKIQLKSAKN